MVSKKGMTRFRRWILVCMLLLFAGLCACADQKTADVREENNSSAYNTASTEKTGIEIWEKEWDENALESFGRYYVKLVQSDRLEELEEHVISVRLDLNEAALLGEYDALSHFEGFSEGKYNAREVFVLRADIDGDGNEDIIEYGMDNYLTFIHETSSISIYRNNGDDFELMYLQPRFDETYFHVSVPCRVEVVRYGEGTFLIFSPRDDLITGSVEIFWIHGWDVAGKMRLITRFEQEAAGHAVGDCRGWCEWKEEESGGRFPYGVRIAYEESEQPKLYGMEDEEKQDAINEAIAAMVCEEAEHGILSGHYEQKYGYARYTLLRATEDEIIMDYGYEWRDEEGILRTNHFIFSVNIKTNDCEILLRMDYDDLLERGDRFDEWFDDNRW